MASGPPDDGSILPEGWTWGDVGHGALDIGGLVPVFGEAADLANAVWYAAQGRYLEAGLSLVSMVPIVGDVIGKGGKIASKLSGPALKKLAKLVKTMDFAKTLAPFRANKKLAPHIDRMIEALQKWRSDIIDRACGVASCPAALAAKAARAALEAASRRTGIPVAKLEGILATPKGKRPDPSTYMSKDQIAKHLDQFDDGGSRLMLKGNLDKYGPGREDGTSFLMTKAQADKMLKEAGGDLRKLEDALGLPKGQLDGDALVRVDFPKPRDIGLRVPSGNEAGANQFWLPGGKLPDGALEAVVDISKLKPGDMITTVLGKGR